jgi:hypothetical protein
MPNSKNYIEEFGDITFEERPFCDADALALCQVFYMPLEQVVSSDFSEEKSFSEACHELFDLRNNKHKALGLMITKNPSVNLMLMADTKRFSDIKIAAVEEVFSSEPAIQYCAGTFILPNGDLAIVYRGTDDTIAGWVEDLDLMVRKGTPAYEFALRHLEKAAAKYNGRIYLCGHSKGGNIALRSAIKCSDEIRSRIISVFNYDGPGFFNYHLFNTPAYSEILPGYRHFVPSSSMIGMMLCHDYDYQAVKSSRLTGAFQHDLGTWQIEDGELVLKPDVNFMAKLTDEWLATLIDSLTENTIFAVDTVVTKVTQATGVITLTELTKHLKTAVGGAVAAYKEIDPQTKEYFKEAFSGAGKMLISAAKAVKDNASDRAANILANRILNN